jgi:DNA replication licensing factor MCM2
MIIRTMCSTNSSSLEVSYGHLADNQSLLAIWLTDVPRDMLLIFDEVLRTVVLNSFSTYEKV